MSPLMPFGIHSFDISKFIKKAAYRKCTQQYNKTQIMFLLSSFIGNCCLASNNMFFGFKLRGMMASTITKFFKPQKLELPNKHVFLPQETVSKLFSRLKSKQIDEHRFLSPLITTHGHIILQSHFWLSN